MAMDLPAIIYLRGWEWHNVAEFMKLSPFKEKLFRGGKLSRFQFVREQKLQRNVDFAIASSGQPMTIHDNNHSRNDVVLISRIWMDNWIAENMESPNAKRRRTDDIETTDVELTSNEEVLSISPESFQLLPGVPIPDEIRPSMLPEIQLDDSEMFCDDNGQPVRVRIVGERHPNFIYFRGPDIGNYLRIQLDLTKRAQLQTPEEYITVIEGISQPVHYLRYLGLLKLIFSVRKRGTAQRLQTWAMRVLFDVQFTARHTMGVSQTVVQPFLRISDGAISGLYVCWMQDVAILRHELAIEHDWKDQDGVYLVGITRDLNNTLQSLRRQCQIVTRNLADDLRLVLFSPTNLALHSLVEPWWTEFLARYEDHELSCPVSGAKCYILNHVHIAEIRKQLQTIRAMYGCSEDMDAYTSNIRQTAIAAMVHQHDREKEILHSRMQAELDIQKAQYEKQIAKLLREKDRTG